MTCNKDCLEDFFSKKIFVLSKFDGEQQIFFINSL